MEQFHISPISLSLLMSIAMHGVLWFKLNLPDADTATIAAPTQTIEVSLIPRLPQAVTPAPKKITHRPVKVNKPVVLTQATLPTIEPEPVTESDNAMDEVQNTPIINSKPEAPRYDARYLNNPPPAYPLAARRRNIEGKVLVRAEVQTDGSCSQVELKTGSDSTLLNQAALDAVKKWRFIPATLHGETIVAWVEIPITFKLNN